MITDYNGLTLGQYQAIDKVINDTSRDELEQQVGILAILAGTTEAELLRLPLADYATLAGQSAFLREPLAKVPKVAKQYQVGSYTLQPCKDYTKLTAGQYIDFQAFTRDKLDYCGLLSVLLVPKGKAYGDGYDTADVRQAIADHLPMPDGMALIAFFFFEAVRSLNKGFPNLLHARTAEDEGPAEADGTATADKPGAGTFADRWGWIENVSQVAQAQGISWDAVLAKTALEFLNTMAYLRDRAEWQKEEMDKWKRTH